MGDKSVDVQKLQDHSKEVNFIAEDNLKAAAKILNAGGVFDLEGGDFSVTCAAASAAYPMAVQFAFEDIKLEARTAVSFAERIRRAAMNYGEADDAANVGQR
ncbi:hypothetical protein ETD83_19305 [Actinomadura soli]|uniref:Uncharacterized protein n=1 Tax=Actinomadura soli TaxID=2508997 RepID=A0A5C4JAU2_9ACTN|nr:hypothetical protein [Actinomadura soli]TMQ98306.1 hypothetical protein ETD83_19305 [Actinomadura soli]